MGEILETVMLICFGCSWPISVIKNYRAKSAKNMSLQFTLLISLGYIAGITAKIITGNTGIALVVYFINLAMVLLNVAIYFRNKRLDKKIA